MHGQGTGARTQSLQALWEHSTLSAPQEVHQTESSLNPVV